MSDESKQSIITSWEGIQVIENITDFKNPGVETPMSPGRGSHVTDGKPDILIRPC